MLQHLRQMLSRMHVASVYWVGAQTHRVKRALQRGVPCELEPVTLLLPETWRSLTQERKETLKHVSVGQLGESPGLC